MPVAFAGSATKTVSNCNDSGPGSLRAAVAAASSGDRIDLTSLRCDRIVLTRGSIEVPQDNLSVVGRGRFEITLDGNDRDRVFHHRGRGVLLIDRVSIARGRLGILGEQPEQLLSGGCIHSEGTVRLHRSRVHHCNAYLLRISGSARGGGVSARRVELSYSSVFSNSAREFGVGGGIFADSVSLYRSQVYGNRADVAGGGISSRERTTAIYSFVHDNRASLGAGIAADEVYLNKTSIVGNTGMPSLISGNTSSWGGGIAARNPSGRNVVVDSSIVGNAVLGEASDFSAATFAGEATILNSTIVENQQESPSPCNRGALRAPRLHLESSIVTSNYCPVEPPDPSRIDIDADTITGANNLVGSARAPLPGDTLIFFDPLLEPVASSGAWQGLRRPSRYSPAIDRGSNILGRRFDQRGPGYPRVKGAAADIGAVER